MKVTPGRGGTASEPRLTSRMLASPVGENEATLVLRARQGDSAALDQLYRAHKDQVYTLCLNLCGNREEAQDLLQDTFVRAWRGMPKFAGRSSLRTWLCRIAINVARDAARRRRRERNPVEMSQGADVAMVDSVRAVLAALRPSHRAVLALRFSQSLSYQEIAECLNWSLGRVKVTLHRAKREFKEAYLRTNESQP